MRKEIQVLVSTFVFALLAVFLLDATPALAQTGKVNGQVVSAESGEPIPGANVVIVGTQQGTSTNPDGRYTILNVAPGTYDLRASFVGFEAQTVQGVEVSIDLTTTVNFELPEETVGLEGVTVTAEDRVVKEDLSASRVDISAEDLQNLPVTDLSSAVGLQAGVQGLQIRGSGADEANVLIDGAGLSSGRSNNPYTGFSYTSVQEVQVQSGGFNAEFGNIRSGVVNVTTKEGPRDRYEADVLARYAPVTEKHFGPAANDPSAYWMRPYLDEAVAFEGTEDSGAWDGFTRRQYPTFRGYNQLAREQLGNDAPQEALDMLAQTYQDLFQYRHRRDISVQGPDYIIDGTIGGPVPVVSDFLGDLRFAASYRQEQNEYVVPLSRSGYDAYNARLKLTSDVTSTIKLTLQGMRGLEQGSNLESRDGITQIRRDGDRDRVYGFGRNAFYNPGYGDGGDGIFGTGKWSRSDIRHTLISAKLNQTLSDNTFYEFQLQRYETEYRTFPEVERSSEIVRTFGEDIANQFPNLGFSPFEVTEGPLGFQFASDPLVETRVASLRIAEQHSQMRDTSDVAEWRAKFDLTSQIGQFNEAQFGFEFSIEDQDVDYEFQDVLLQPSDVRASWQANPIYGAVYAQDKLEFKGMIANAGLRLDYFNANTDRIIVDRFDDALLGKNEDSFDEMVERQDAEAQISLSPRLGVSFPIREGSKLYFNYGHFYQDLTPNFLYMVERQQRTNEVTQLANPDVPRPKTIAYEVGYEQSFFDTYLVRIAGYYKDVLNQPRWVGFESRDGLIDYSTNFAENYEDIRGVEFSVFKNVGEWFQGFVNYTFDVRSRGDFGLSQFFENEVQQAEFERTSVNFQDKALPRPFGRLSLTFLTPDDFGPEVGGVQVLGDWRINFLGQWQAGDYQTWTNGIALQAVEDNLQWKSFRIVDMRLSKNFNVEGFDAQLFADVNNIFNIKNFNRSAFVGPQDFDDYVNSLHLPREWVVGENESESWLENYEPRDENGDPIFGNDRPGDLDGDHIDPPNASSFRHLFPRAVNLGLRLSF